MENNAFSSSGSHRRIQTYTENVNYQQTESTVVKRTFVPKEMSFSISQDVEVVRMQDKCKSYEDEVLRLKTQHEQQTKKLKARIKSLEQLSRIADTLMEFNFKQFDDFEIILVDSIKACINKYQYVIPLRSTPKEFEKIKQLLEERELREFCLNRRIFSGVSRFIDKLGTRYSSAQKLLDSYCNKDAKELSFGSHRSQCSEKDENINPKKIESKLTASIQTMTEDIFPVRSGLSFEYKEISSDDDLDCAFDAIIGFISSLEGKDSRIYQKYSEWIQRLENSFNKGLGNSSNPSISFKIMSFRKKLGSIEESNENEENYNSKVSSDAEEDAEALLTRTYKIEAKNDELDVSLNLKQLEISKLQDRIEELLQEQAFKKTEIDLLSSEINVLLSNKIEDEKALSSLENEFINKKKHIIELKRVLNKNTEELSEFDIEEVDSEITKITKQNLSIKQELSKRKKELDLKHRQLREENSIFEHLNEELKDIDHRIEKVDNKLTKLQELSNSTKKTISSSNGIEEKTIENIKTRIGVFERGLNKSLIHLETLHELAQEYKSDDLSEKTTSEVTKTLNDIASRLLKLGELQSKFKSSTQESISRIMVSLTDLEINQKSEVQKSKYCTQELISISSKLENILTEIDQSCREVQNIKETTLLVDEKARAISLQEIDGVLNMISEYVGRIYTSLLTVDVKISETAQSMNSDADLSILTGLRNCIKHSTENISKLKSKKDEIFQYFEDQRQVYSDIEMQLTKAKITETSIMKEIEHLETKLKEINYSMFTKNKEVFTIQGKIESLLIQKHAKVAEIGVDSNALLEIETSLTRETKILEGLSAEQQEHYYTAFKKSLSEMTASQVMNLLSILVTMQEMALGSIGLRRESATNKLFTAFVAGKNDTDKMNRTVLEFIKTSVLDVSKLDKEHKEKVSEAFEIIIKEGKVNAARWISSLVLNDESMNSFLLSCAKISEKDWRNSLRYIANLISFMMKTSTTILNYFNSSVFFKEHTSLDEQGLLKNLGLKFSESIFTRHSDIIETVKEFEIAGCKGFTQFSEFAKIIAEKGKTEAVNQSRLIQEIDDILCNRCKEIDDRSASTILFLG